MSEGEKDRGYDQGADRAKKEMMKKKMLRKEMVRELRRWTGMSYRRMSD